MGLNGGWDVQVQQLSNMVEDLRKRVETLEEMQNPDSPRFRRELLGWAEKLAGEEV